MSNSDTIFFAASEPLDRTVEWLSAVLRLEPLEDPELDEGAYLFTGRARTMDGDLVFVIEPNTYGEVDPDPEDVSAIDRYPGVVTVRLAGKKDEELQNGRRVPSSTSWWPAGRTWRWFSATRCP